MGTTKSTIKIRRGVTLSLILLTIPVTILLSWDGEKQEQKYRDKLCRVSLLDCLIADLDFKVRYQ
jgi:hypothetical protein